MQQKKIKDIMDKIKELEEITHGKPYLDVFKEFIKSDQCPNFVKSDVERASKPEQCYNEDDACTTMHLSLTSMLTNLSILVFSNLRCLNIMISAGILTMMMAEKIMTGLENTYSLRMQLISGKV